MCALAKKLVDETYGRPCPNKTIANKPRVDIPFTAREFSKLLLAEHEESFKLAMNGTQWKSASGKVQELPHHTFLEKYFRSLKYIKYDSSVAPLRS